SARAVETRDLRVRFRASKHLAMEHPRQREVGAVDRGAADLAGRVEPRERLADHACRGHGFSQLPQPTRSSRSGGGEIEGWSEPATTSRAAARTASAIFWYPVQRQRFPARASRT